MNANVVLYYTHKFKKIKFNLTYSIYYICNINIDFSAASTFQPDRLCSRFYDFSAGSTTFQPVTTFQPGFTTFQPTTCSADATWLFSRHVRNISIMLIIYYNRIKKIFLWKNKGIAEYHYVEAHLKTSQL